MLRRVNIPKDAILQHQCVFNDKSYMNQAEGKSATVSCSHWYTETLVWLECGPEQGLFWHIPSVFSDLSSNL
jgi:hypothetical protein